MDNCKGCKYYEKVKFAGYKHSCLKKRKMLVGLLVCNNFVEKIKTTKKHKNRKYTAEDMEKAFEAGGDLADSYEMNFPSLDYTDFETWIKKYKADEHKNQ